MSYRRRMSAKEHRRQIHRRHITIIAACIVLAAVVVGGTYGITRLVLQKSKPAAAVNSAVSAVKKPAASQIPVASTGNPNRRGDALEVVKTNLTGYQTKYPQLYAKRKVGQWKNAEKKTIYLTFDDGPSPLTPQLLAVLKKYNVKATFFLTNQPEQKNDIHYIRNIYESGCTCAVHSACHNYKKIYASVDAFLADFDEMYQIIQKQTDGHCAPFFRFPGGSNNPRLSAPVHQQIIQEMLRRGFFFYDWDVDSKDAMGAGADAIFENVTAGMRSDGNVILMHNSAVKKATLSEVGNMIEYGLQNGYTFKALDGTLDPSMYCFSTKTMIPLLKNNPNFRLSAKHEARFASLLGTSPASSGSSTSSELSTEVADTVSNGGGE